MICPLLSLGCAVHTPPSTSRRVRDLSDHEQRHSLLPFLADLAATGRILADRLIGAFERFLRNLLQQLDAPTIVATLLASYAEPVRSEAGLPPPQPWVHGCPEVVNDADAQAAARAATEVAERFRTYLAALRPYYLLCYLENVLGLVGQILGKTDMATNLGHMLNFMRTCIAARPRVAPEPSA